MLKGDDKMFKDNGIWRELGAKSLEDLNESVFPYQIPREEVNYVLEPDYRMVGGVNPQ